MRSLWYLGFLILVFGVWNFPTWVSWGAVISFWPPDFLFVAMSHPCCKGSVAPSTKGVLGRSSASPTRFLRGGSQAKRGRVTCPRSHSQSASELLNIPNLILAPTLKGVVGEQRVRREVWLWPGEVSTTDFPHIYTGKWSQRKDFAWVLWSLVSVFWHMVLLTQYRFTW